MKDTKVLSKISNNLPAYFLSLFSALVVFLLGDGTSVAAGTYYSQSLPQTGAQVTRTALIVGVVLLIVGGFFFFRNRKNKK
ncbi:MULTISPECIES: LPXTG cell wall anchor domain-containing protein [Aerococcus]|uniref:LPXTG cell wall anchor domain-containing protein n=2 Tax=Aerococcus TaxID=1375 RepID=A0A178HHH6_9LACT|nr:MULTISPECIES: LPXTG cell wall anchor domain-containing protein [Aerococcus]KAA9218575.1 LPXTG cell wall anchor domain-containing protein [Aerococcus loyolae]KAA9264752.1 LPXTG cell wall anchor domain-containing protein [Aerococcus loyolae]MCY3026091.1 LPXTG cell wall anchor domain-containing protein [Aerococcus loyolae]MCY3028186.1 LPXTG cell wall anchor domain-containing protein [Aerococcus loyolae]MCY3029350.1 LPXTG cell wall anchor domain-containing protein [Aerococcus loyolae]